VNADIVAPGYQRNITLLYAYSVSLKRVALPILVVFYLAQGLTYTQIGIIAAMQNIMLILFDVPTGLITDKFGCKSSMVIAAILSTLSMTLIYMSTSFTAFVVASALYGLGFAFDSGTRSSLLYGSLTKKGKTSFGKYYGKIISFAYLINAFLLLTVPLLAQFDLRWPILINAGICAASILIVLGFKEPVLTRHAHEHSYKHIFTTAVKTLKQSRQAQFITVFATLVLAFLYVLMESKQAFMNEVGLPVTLFGAVYFGMRILYSMSSYLTHRLQQHISGKTMVFVGVVAVAAGLLGLGLVGTVYGLIFILWLAFIEGFLRIFLEDEINSVIPDNVRATVLSLKSSITSLFQAGLAVLLGYLADNLGLMPMFIVAAALFTALSVIVIIIYRKELSALVIKREADHVLD